MSRVYFHADPAGIRNADDHSHAIKPRMPTTASRAWSFHTLIRGTNTLRFTSPFVALLFLLFGAFLLASCSTEHPRSGADVATTSALQRTKLITVPEVHSFAAGSTIISADSISAESYAHVEENE